MTDLEENKEPARAESPLGRLVNRLSNIGGALAAIGVMAILLMVSAEMLLRNLMGVSTMVADEMAGYLNAAVVCFGLAYTFRAKGFIRVELLYHRLRGRVLLAARWLFTTASFVYVALLVYHVAKQVIYYYRGNIRSDSLSQTALYIPSSVMVIGCVLLLLQLAVLLLDGVRDDC